MLHIHYVNGSIDTQFDINPTTLAGTLNEFQTAMADFTGGKLATIGSDGYVRLAEKGDKFVGFIVNDASGYTFENVPAMASGKLPLMMGGGLATTDQVLETTIVAGDILYIGDDGLLTKVATGAEVFGQARSSNNAQDKSVQVYF